VEIRNYYESEKYYKLGSKHEQKGETELALQQYEKSSILMPKAMNPLKKLSGLYTKAGNYDKAISAYIRLLKIYPRQYTYDYNIACLYALKDDKQNSTTWLKKAIDKGYRNWVLIQNDKDLDNIRDTTFYHDLMKRR
jgi:Flp pilus assembly protein TadD